jgi:hypothetical protein
MCPAAADINSFCPRDYAAEALADRPPKHAPGSNGAVSGGKRGGTLDRQQQQEQQRGAASSSSSRAGSSSTRSGDFRLEEQLRHYKKRDGSVGYRWGPPPPAGTASEGSTGSEDSEGSEDSTWRCFKAMRLTDQLVCVFLASWLVQSHCYWPAGLCSHTATARAPAVGGSAVQRSPDDVRYQQVMLHSTCLHPTLH